MKHKTSEVAKKLGITQPSVYKIYNQLLNKIEKVKRNGHYKRLSNQQQRIHILCKKGYKDRQIAEELGIRVSSVTTQKNRIKNKLSTKSV